MNCPGHATSSTSTVGVTATCRFATSRTAKCTAKRQRGELSGLSRVWSFTIDDGHLFVRPDRIEREIRQVIDLIFEVIETSDLDVEVASPPPPDVRRRRRTLGARRGATPLGPQSGGMEETSRPATARSTAGSGLQF